jgi:hypothetical protein
MSVLLGVDEVVLYGIDVEDEHGWATPAQAEAWRGSAGVQESIPTTDARAAEGGGSGPFSPSSRRLAVAYLPEDCPVLPGWRAFARDTWWTVGGVNPVPDPLGGGLGCLVAALTEDVRVDQEVGS